MTRIAVFGTSHVAALKLGWDRIAAEHPGVTCEFLAIRRSDFGLFSLDAAGRFGLHAAGTPEARRVLARSGRATLDLAAADVALWAGMESRLSVMAELLADCEVAGLGARGAPTALTEAAFLGLMRGTIRAGLPGPEWAALRGPRRLAWLEPVPAESCLHSPQARYAAWRRAAGAGAALGPAREKVLALHREALEGIGFELLEQPPETFAPSGLTDARHARGAMRLDGDGMGEADHSHMNPDFGALAMRALLARIAAGARAEAAPAGA